MSKKPAPKMIVKPNKPKLPNVEGAVNLTFKDYPHADIKRCPQALPCDKQHGPYEDILIVLEKLAWCPCGKIYLHEPRNDSWVQLTPV